MEKFLYRRMLRALTLLGVLFAVLCYLRVAETGMAVYTAVEAPTVVTSLPQTGKKQVYLTFDTAMGEDYVSEILAVLRKYHAKASFGILGDWMEAYPDAAQEIRKSGMAVFCHSMHHARYVDLSRAEMQADAEQAKAAVEAFFGRECHYIRPPYGAYTKEVAEAMEEAGMRVLLWNRDSEDWRKDASAEDILENALHAVAPGDILLFQTNAAQTAPALEVLLPTLRRMGYEFAQIKN